MKSKETVSEVKETVSEETVSAGKNEVAKKPKKKARGGNSPVIGMNGYNLEEGDNTKFLSVQMELFNLPDIDLESVEEVAERLNEYFRIYATRDMKPTVAGMALALNGRSRQWLWAVTHGQAVNGQGYEPALPPRVADLIKKAYFLLENLWEAYMTSGKINPVAGIFLAKNNYGYQDKTEYVLTPNQNNDSDYNTDEIRERYIQTAEQKRLSDNSTDDTSND